VIDPWLSYFGHPKLPAGYNSWEHDGDDINGSGVNEPVWPQLFDTFVALEVLIITEDMMDIFETGCPDLIIPYDKWEIGLPGEVRVVAVTDVWSSLAVPATAKKVLLPQETRVVKIKEPT
jgi:hypothetical protein